MSKTSIRKPRKKKLIRRKRDVPKKNLADILGFTTRYLSGLMKRGLPHSKVKNANGKGGKPVPHFNLSESIQWLSAKGIATPEAKGKAASMIAASMSGTPTSDKDQESPKDTPARGEVSIKNIDMELFKQPGILGALERLKLQEYNASRAMIQLLKTAAPKDEITAMERLHTRTCTSLRQAEFAAIEYRKRTGEIVEFDGMVNAWERLGVVFKNAVLGIANTVTPKLKRYLKDPENNLQRVADLISEASRLVLMGLPNEIPTGSDQEDSGGGHSPASSSD